MLTDAEQAMVADAQEALVFRRGLEEGGGVPEHVHRIGRLGSAVIELAEQLASERSARRAIQDSRDRAYGMLEQRTGNTVVDDLDFGEEAAA